MFQKYLQAFILIGLLGLAACEKITDAPSEQSAKEIIKEYFTREENLNVEIFDFRSITGSAAKKDGSAFYTMVCNPQIALPKTALGIERRNIKAIIGFVKKAGSKDWQPNPKFKIKISILRTTMDCYGIRPYYHSENPVYGISCPRNNRHFIKVKSAVCESCRIINEDVVINSWANQLACLNCGGAGQCAYCGESVDTLSLKCEACDGTAQCPACQGNGQCSYCAGSGKSEGNNCEMCGGTGKCALCRGNTKCKYCDGTGKLSLKCPSCQGSGQCFYCSKLEAAGKDFGKEHRLEDCKFCKGTGKCTICSGSGRNCHFCNGTKVCRYCQGKKSFSLSDFNSDGTLKKVPGN